MSVLVVHSYRSRAHSVVGPSTVNVRLPFSSTQSQEKQMGNFLSCHVPLNIICDIFGAVQSVKWGCHCQFLRYDHDKWECSYLSMRLPETCINQQLYVCIPIFLFLRNMMMQPRTSCAVIMLTTHSLFAGNWRWPSAFQALERRYVVKILLTKCRSLLVNIYHTRVINCREI